MYFASYQFDDLFIRLCRVLAGAQSASPRGEPTKEILNANLALHVPCRCILTNPVRRQSHSYLEHELQWYASGDKSIEYISPFAKQWSKVADEDGTANSAYGWQIFTQATPTGVNQFDFVVSELKSDRESRRAIININQIIHKYETKDVPCTLTLQFLVRSNQLIQISTMRSTDLVWGLCNDVPFFSMLQLMILLELRKSLSRLVLGPLYLNTGSLHVYERHFDLVSSVASLDSGHTYTSSCLDKFLANSSVVTFNGVSGDCCGDFSELVADAHLEETEPTRIDGHRTFIYPVI